MNCGVCTVYEDVDYYKMIDRLVYSDRMHVTMRECNFSLPKLAHSSSQKKHILLGHSIRRRIERQHVYDAALDTIVKYGRRGKLLNSFVKTDNKVIYIYIL